MKKCPHCNERHRFIDASDVTVNTFDVPDIIPMEQCVNCGAVFCVTGKCVRLVSIQLLPPRMMWGPPGLWADYLCGTKA